MATARHGMAWHGRESLGMSMGNLSLGMVQYQTKW